MSVWLQENDNKICPFQLKGEWTKIMPAKVHIAKVHNQIENSKRIMLYIDALATTIL